MKQAFDAGALVRRLRNVKSVDRDGLVGVVGDRRNGKSSASFQLGRAGWPESYTHRSKVFSFTAFKEQVLNPWHGWRGPAGHDYDLGMAQMEAALRDLEQAEADLDDTQNDLEDAQRDHDQSLVDELRVLMESLETRAQRVADVLLTGTMKPPTSHAGLPEPPIDVDELVKGFWSTDIRTKQGEEAEKLVAVMGERNRVGFFLCPDYKKMLGALKLSCQFLVEVPRRGELVIWKRNPKKQFTKSNFPGYQELGGDSFPDPARAPTPTVWRREWRKYLKAKHAMVDRTGRSAGENSGYQAPDTGDVEALARGLVTALG